LLTDYVGKIFHIKDIDQPFGIRVPPNPNSSVKLGILFTHFLNYFIENIGFI
jgi:hypothetical protein